jgi:hypothetical protein
MFTNPAFLAMYADARITEHSVRAPRFEETSPRSRRLVPTLLRLKLVSDHKQSVVAANESAA